MAEDRGREKTVYKVKGMKVNCDHRSEGITTKMQKKT